MALNKIGSPSKIKVVKNSSFSMSPDALAQLFLEDWPEKKVSMDQIHEGLKSIGIIDYSAEDFSILIGRLEAIGFIITK